MAATLLRFVTARDRQRPPQAAQTELPMYLAKFFHRPPGDDDRELLFIAGGDPMIIGIYMIFLISPRDVSNG